MSLFCFDGKILVRGEKKRIYSDPLSVHSTQCYLHEMSDSFFKRSTKLQSSIHLSKLLASTCLRLFLLNSNMLNYVLWVVTAVSTLVWQQTLLLAACSTKTLFLHNFFSKTGDQPCQLSIMTSLKSYVSLEWHTSHEGVSIFSSCYFWDVNSISSSSWSTMQKELYGV